MYVPERDESSLDFIYSCRPTELHFWMATVLPRFAHANPSPQTPWGKIHRSTRRKRFSIQSLWPRSSQVFHETSSCSCSSAKRLPRFWSASLPETGNFQAGKFSTAKRRNPDCE